jgi:hypothetical protein
MFSRLRVQMIPMMAMPTVLVVELFVVPLQLAVELSSSVISGLLM